MLPSSLLAGLIVLVQTPGTVRTPGKKPQSPDGNYQPAVKLPDDFVRYARVPDGGIQPHVVAAGDELAVLYFKGDAQSGDLFLTRSKDEARTFAPSARVDAEPGTVLTQEAGHSGALTVGADGRALVAWVAGGAAPALRFAREKAGGGFDAPLDLGSPAQLCRTCALVADAQGRVRVFYVALDPEVGEGEKPGLRIWMRVSEDGATFGAPEAIDQKPDGVAASSAIDARIDRDSGAIYVFYVSAGRHGGPEVKLLASTDGGAKFASRVIVLATRHDVVPHSRPSLSQEVATDRTVGKPLVIASWDLYAQVNWGGIDPASHKLQQNIPVSPRETRTSRRYCAVGLSAGTEYLMAWLEQPVGDRSAPPVLAWQVWFIDGLAPLGWGQAPIGPGVSSPAVIANHPRGFTILY